MALSAQCRSGAEGGAKVNAAGGTHYAILPRGGRGHHRPIPADFAEKAREMSRDDLRAHYKASGETIMRWRKQVGIEPPRYDPPPADFAHHATREHKTALGRRYNCSLQKIDRWLRETGITPPVARTGPAKNRRPVPASFAQVAPTMFKKQLRAHYGINGEGLERWIAESGVQAKQYENTGGFRFARVPGQSNVAALRNYGIHDQAADVLRKYMAVYRCDERGRANEKGKFWRVGQVVVDGDELLARAERKKGKAA